jgi:hypothetical protein
VIRTLARRVPYRRVGARGLSGATVVHGVHIGHFGAESLPARKGLTGPRAIGRARVEPTVLQTADTCGLNWQYVASRRTSPHIRHNRTKAAVGKPGPNRDFFRGATRVPSFSCADHGTCILIPLSCVAGHSPRHAAGGVRIPGNRGTLTAALTCRYPRPAATGFADLCLASKADGRTGPAGVARWPVWRPIGTRNRRHPGTERPVAGLLWHGSGRTE